MRVLASILIVALLVGTARADVSVPTGFNDDVIVRGLDQPNSMAFLPDGRVLVTEQRTGKVRLIVGNHIARYDPLLTVSALADTGLEEGLQGIAVDPAWPQRPFVYIFYTRRGNTLRLERYMASGELTSPTGENMTLSNPLILIGSISDLSPNHNSGCLRFSPEGYMFVSLGDDERHCPAQDPTSLMGAILRLRVDTLPATGGPEVPRNLLLAPGNPIASSNVNARLVWAYGLRNPWRYQVDPTTGLLYVADPGEATAEEIDEVRPGDNLGWPFREGNQVETANGCTEPPGFSSKPPIIEWLRDPSLTAIVSAGVYRDIGNASGNWPGEYDGSLFWGEYYRGFLRRLVKTASGWSNAPAVAGQPNATDWATGLTFASDFVEGADGSLWWLQQFDNTMNPGTGSLHRIRGPATVPDSLTGQPLRLSASPNPFKTSMNLAFQLERPAIVTLTILDVSGRIVRRLVNDAMSLDSGELRIAWDGADDHGRSVPTGLYLARLQVAGQQATVRVLRIR